MEEQRERVTLGVDAETKRRLKAAAAARGVSVSVYCRAAIDKELAQDSETGEVGEREWPADEAVKQFEATRRKYGSAKPTTKTAVDYIREGREIRDRQMDEWLKPQGSSSL